MRHENVNIKGSVNTRGFSYLQPLGHCTGNPGPIPAFALGPVIFKVLIHPSYAKSIKITTEWNSGFGQF